LLPLPLLQPWAWETAFAVTLIFPAVGIWVDARRIGRVHPAWQWGLGVTFAAFFLVEAVTYSPVGAALYRAVTAGSPGAAVPALDFGSPPPGPLITGRH